MHSKNEKSHVTSEQSGRALAKSRVTGDSCVREYVTFSTSFFLATGYGTNRCQYQELHNECSSNPELRCKSHYKCRVWSPKVPLRAEGPENANVMKNVTQKSCRYWTANETWFLVWISWSGGLGQCPIPKATKRISLKPRVTRLSQAILVQIRFNAKSNGAKITLKLFYTEAGEMCIRKTRKVT